MLAPSFTGDFDFDASNAKLDKDKLAEEFNELKVTDAVQDTEVTEPADDACYEPKSSFFDDISCESKGG